MRINDPATLRELFDVKTRADELRKVLDDAVPRREGGEGQHGGERWLEAVEHFYVDGYRVTISASSEVIRATVSRGAFEVYRFTSPDAERGPQVTNAERARLVVEHVIRQLKAPRTVLEGR